MGKNEKSRRLVQEVKHINERSSRKRKKKKKEESIVLIKDDGKFVYK